ncbi:MAG: DUF1573 domain-containing protein [Flavobacteriia bacterium]|nr:DUF1573 domain-containing protein [Flavobacteriia bacterium]
MIKTLSLFLILVAVTSCNGNSKLEVGEKTTMYVKDIYDAGKIVKGELISAKITVKNTGNFPLIIGEVVGSCSCTVAEKPENPIQPGETGTIKAKVTTEMAHEGLISKSLRIVANTEPSVTNIVIKAEILGK